jgi:hypothetical protein
LIEIELSFLGVLDRIAFQLHPPDTLNHLTSIEIYHRILAKHRVDGVDALDTALSVMLWLIKRTSLSCVVALCQYLRRIRVCVIELFALKSEPAYKLIKKKGDPKATQLKSYKQWLGVYASSFLFADRA